jgi:hypothetical protein
MIAERGADLILGRAPLPEARLDDEQDQIKGDDNGDYATGTYRNGGRHVADDQAARAG